MLKKIILMSVIPLASCQMFQYQPYAKDVKKKPNQGGVVAMRSGFRDEDRMKAESMMQRNCSPLRYVILEEGETVIGQSTSTSGNESYDEGAEGKKVGSFLGAPIMSGAKDPSKSMNSQSTVTNLTEWQIQYKCTK